MPFYNYVCPDHGEFEQRAGYGDDAVPCACGQPSPRRAVYPLSFVMEGRSLPRRDDVETVQDEYRKEVAKRGWTAERAVGELRATKFTDAEGQLRVDTRKMTQVA